MSYGRSRHRRALLKGIVTYHGEALSLVESPGDVAIVQRGVYRSLIMHCPDGCGEVITINLDPRTSKAWRIYLNKKGLTLFPSVWRDTGCESHFVLWNSVFYWMDAHDTTDSDPKEERRLDAAVLSQTHLANARNYVEIADALDEIPWAVLDSCRRLVKAGLVKPVDEHKTSFVRTSVRS